MSQLIWDIIINYQKRIFDLNKSHKGRPKNCDISLWINTNLTWQKYRFRLQKEVKFENRYHILNFHGLNGYVVTFYKFKRRFNDQFTFSNRFWNFKIFFNAFGKNLILFNRMCFENKRFFQNAFNFVRFGPMTF